MANVKFGATCPHLDARVFAELAADAEAAGWDGIFIWDPVWGVDAWIALAAAAMTTNRVSLGTMLTPLSRRRPWKVASEVATLDRLSNGRVILPVGLGAALEAPPNNWFEQVGEATDRQTRAELLDEAIAVITGLWTGQPFSYTGKHFRLTDVTFVEIPIQQPRPPIWVVAAWPFPKSMRRALSVDGILPLVRPAGEWAVPGPDATRAIAEYIAANRSATTPFDIVIEGETPGDDPVAAANQLRPLAEAGMTWWLENVWAAPWQSGGVEGIRQRLRQGPPRARTGLEVPC